MGVCAGLVALPDERRGLEAVHVRHLHVQQDHGEVMGEEPLQRLAPGLRLDQVLPQPLEHRLERDEVGGLVVDQQDVDAVVRRVAGSGAAGRRRTVTPRRGSAVQLLHRRA